MNNVYAVIDGTNTVVNTIVWDGVSPWTSPDGTTVVQNAASIGWSYDPVAQAFNAPAIQASPPTPQVL